MVAQRITKSTVDALEARETDRFIWDERLSGFGVKVTPKGRKVYVIDYRMPGRRGTNRYTIGTHGSPWTAEQARAEAKVRLLEISQGTDPMATRRARRKETVDYGFDAYSERFIEGYLRANWPGSFDRAVSVVRRHAQPFFKRRDIRDIAKQECAAFVDQFGEMPATGRKAVEVVGKLFRWAEDRGDIERSPMDRIPIPKPSAGRERVLSHDEVHLLWKATDQSAHPYGPLVRMLLLTGQRRGEIGGMRWNEIDWEAGVWEVPSSRTKSGRGHVTPLTPMMLSLLREMPRHGSLVFSVSGENELGNHSKLKLNLDAKIMELAGDDLEAWTLHDIRRTAATGMQRLGVSPDLIEVLQGRTRKLGAGARYQRYDYLDERRAALEVWNGHLARLID